MVGRVDLQQRRHQRPLGQSRLPARHHAPHVLLVLHPHPGIAQQLGRWPRTRWPRRAGRRAGRSDRGPAGPRRSGTGRPGPPGSAAARSLPPPPCRQPRLTRRRASSATRARAGRPGSGPPPRPCARCAPRPRRAGRRPARPRPGATRPGPAPAPSVAPTGTGPSTSAPSGRSASVEQVGHRVGRPGQARHPGRRREAQLAPLGQFAGGERGRVPAQQRLYGDQAAVGHDHHPSALRRRAGPASPRPATGAASPPRPAGRPGSAAPRCRAAAPPRIRPRPAARPPAWRPPAPARRPTVASTPSRPEVRTGAPGNARPSSSAVRPAPITAARSRRAAAPVAGEVGRRPAAPPAGGDGVRRAQLERAGAPSTSGRRVTLHTGHRRQVAAARHLDQHRRPAGQRVPGGPPGQAGQPGGRRGRIPVPVGVVAGRRDLRGSRADHVPVGRQRVRPSASPPAAAPRCCATVASTSAPAAGQLGPHQQHLQGVRVRRPRLGVQVVAVVPDRDQPERRPSGRTRPPGCRARPAPRRRLARRNRRYRSAGPSAAGSATCRPVPSASPPPRRAGPGRGRRARPRPRRDHCGRSRRPPRPAGPASPRPAARSRTARGDPPVGAARRADPARPGTRPSRVPARWPRPPQWTRRSGPTRRRGRIRLAGRTRSGRGGAGRRAAARRPGCPAYRSATARASSATSGRSTGSGETTFSRYARLPAWAESSAALEQEAVDQPAGEPHPDPAARHRGRVQLGRHQVVERPVQVGQRHVDRDPGDRRRPGPARELARHPSAQPADGQRAHRHRKSPPGSLTSHRRDPPDQPRRTGPLRRAQDHPLGDGTSRNTPQTVAATPILTRAGAPRGRRS